MERFIVWRGPLFDPSGYGAAGRAYVLALREYGLPVGILARNFVTSDELTEEENTTVSVEDFKALKDLSLVRVVDPERVVFVDHNTPDIVVGMQGASRNVAYTVWETSQISPEAAKRCKNTEEIWTASEYSKQAFVNGGVSADKIFVIPHVCDSRVYHPKAPPVVLAGRPEFLFFSNFEYHKRKGYDILLRAFYRAFRGRSDVGLFVKTYNLAVGIKPSLLMKQYLADLRSDLGMSQAEAPPITVLDRRVGAEALPSLYTAADAYVTASRGEAWNLTLSEAMLSGLPCIAPTIGGHREFMDEDMGWLVSSKMVPIKDKEVETARSVYTPGMEWVDTDEDALVEAMIQVSEDRELGKQRAETAMQRVIDRFSPEKVVELIQERVDA